MDPITREFDVDSSGIEQFRQALESSLHRSGYLPDVPFALLLVESQINPFWTPSAERRWHIRLTFDPLDNPNCLISRSIFEPADFSQLFPS